MILWVRRVCTVFLAMLKMNCTRNTTNRALQNAFFLIEFWAFDQELLFSLCSYIGGIRIGIIHIVEK